MREEWISWDFDDTLYDSKNDRLIETTYNIFKEQQNIGYNLCITTWRDSYDLDDIHRHLGSDIKIFPLCQFDKSIFLRYVCPYNVIMHYDDSLNHVCRPLLFSTKITPVWVTTKQRLKLIKNINEYISEGLGIVTLTDEEAKHF